MLARAIVSSNDHGSRRSDGLVRSYMTTTDCLDSREESQSISRGPALRSLPELQASMRALVSERRELRLKLAPGNATSQASGGSGSTASFKGPMASWDCAVRGKRFRTSEPGPAAPSGTVTCPSSGSASYTASIVNGDPTRSARSQMGAPLLRRGLGRSTMDRVQSLPAPVNPDLVDSPRPSEKRPKVELDRPTMERSRNIFGCLVGHLQKAKSRLDEEKHSRSSELQREMEQQVKQRLELERRNLAELRRRELREAHMQSLKRIREVQSQVRRVESEILTLRLQKHFELLLPFISTETTPTIFWLPSEASPHTEKAHENSCRRIKETMSALERRFFEECAQDDIVLKGFQDKTDGGNASYSHRSIEVEFSAESATPGGSSFIAKPADLRSSTRRKSGEVSSPIRKSLGGPVEVHPDLKRDDTSSEDGGEVDGDDGGSEKDDEERHDPLVSADIE